MFLVANKRDLARESFSSQSFSCSQATESSTDDQDFFFTHVSSMAFD